MSNYTLIVNGQPRGPYTRQECRWMVDELRVPGIAGAPDYHWESQPDGSRLAVLDSDGATLAQVVPA